MAAPQGAKPVKGLWVALPDIPTVPPWALPATWGELEDACQRIAGFSIIGTVIENARLFRTGQRHPVLIGFPTAERVGEEPVRMHWLAAWMPTLSHGTVTANGFVVRVLAGETPERVFEVHGDLGANGASDGMRAA